MTTPLTERILCARSCEPFLAEFNDAVDILENPIEESDERVLIWEAVEHYTVGQVQELIESEHARNADMLHTILEAIKTQIVGTAFPPNSEINMDDLLERGLKQSHK
jgi:hypothetical protein